MNTEELKDKLLKFKELKETYKMYDKLRSDAKRDLDVYQARLHSEMEEHGLESVKHDGFNYVSKTTVYGHVRDLEAFMDWCRRNELDDIYLSVTEEKQRVNELVRQALDSSTELPDGVTFVPRQYISITESK